MNELCLSDFGFRISFLLLALSFSAMVGCSLESGASTVLVDEGDPVDPRSEFSGKLVITGSSTLAPLVSQISLRFEQQHPQTRIDVQTGGTSRGIANVRSGIAQIGMASRALHEAEQDLTVHAVAVDGVGFIVHADNPLRSIGSRQVQAIYTGRITQWKDVASVGNAEHVTRIEPVAPSGQIVVVHKAAGRGTRTVFLEHFQLDDGAIEADLIVGDNQHGIKTVAGNRQAIAYVSIGAADAEIRSKTPIRLLTLDGVAPTLGGVAGSNVEDQPYPLQRNLLLITKQSPKGLTKAFLDFARSEEVRDLIQKNDFAPISP